jgi:beta-lactamase class A
MASTMKIAVAAAYLEEVDSGRRSLDDVIAGTSALRLMDAMIVRSDNRATDLLMATLGGPAAIDRWLRAHNLSGIRVDRTIAQLLSDRRDLRDIRDSSTPVAMLGLLRLIDSGAALKPESRHLLLDMMRRCATGSNRIRGILPAGATVEHKTGTLNGYTGDVGYLTTPEGRRIAVVFFARGGSNRPAVIATAARAIYDAFGTQPQRIASVPPMRPTQPATTTLSSSPPGFSAR